MSLLELKKELQSLSNPEKAKQLQRFFKTGKGEYGEGDIFIGLIVPQQRTLAKRYLRLTLREIQELLNSKIHEHRLTALFILINQYSKAKNQKEKQKEIVNLYLNNTNNINNWDLIDLSAPKILGEYYLDKDKKKLYEFANSTDLWEKRIAVLSTFTFIREKRFDDAIKIAEILLKDQHDLIHKAVGWMLREIGKRNLEVEENFLKEHYKSMPRTMLRYSLEKFPENKRKYYMQK